MTEDDIRTDWYPSISNIYLINTVFGGSYMKWKSC